MGVSGFIRGFNFLFRTKPRIRLYPFGYFQRRAFSDSEILNNNDSVLPVLIVGAGPVGLVLSILLTKFGVKCTVLEKNKGFSKHPQAHFINNRNMEVFRKLDGLAEEIQRSQPPVALWRKFIYCTSLTGSVLGSVNHMHPQEGPENLGHEPPKGREILMGHKCVSIDPTDQYVTVTVSFSKDSK